MHTSSEFFVLILLGLFGIALDLLFKIQEWIQTKTNPNISLTIVNTVISILITTVLLYLREDIKEIYPVTKLTAFVMGYLSQNVFRKIIAKKGTEKKIVSEAVPVEIVTKEEAQALKE